MRIITIDWETMGLKSNAPLLSLGYAIGDTSDGIVLESREIIVPESYNISTARPYSPDTILWWLKQARDSEDLQSYIISIMERAQRHDLTSFTTSLELMLEYITYHKVDGLFCTDKNFDYLFLQQVLDNLNLNLPLTYRQLYETRFWQQQDGTREAFRADQSLTIHQAKDDAMKIFNGLHRLIP